jgi:hypothetical protein
MRLVKFVREKKRTPLDVFNEAIQPKAKMALQDLVQKIATYCKRNHVWKNRTGALEDSISWIPPEKQGNNLIATVFAGGWAKAKFAYDPNLRKESGRRKRPYRYQRGARIKVRPGMGLFVKYARFVEDKGFPVLKQGISHYKAKAKRDFQDGLKIGSFR